MTFRSAAPAWRIGMIVPSSGTTMETEIPELLRRQSLKTSDRFTFHSARLRLRQVTPEALTAMNELAIGAVASLCDAEVDALMYACLVSAPFGAASNAPAIVSSAAALVAALHSLGAERIALVAPCRKELTAQIAAAIASRGIAVVQTHSQGLVDNVAIGRFDTGELLAIAGEIDLAGADALVLSACMQMPSLDILDDVEQALGLPVVSAATASAHLLLERLGIEPRIERAGWLLRSSRQHVTRPQALAA